MKQIIILFFVLMGLTSFSQKGKKVQFVGGARSLLSSSELQSPGDTVTAPRSSGGYALLDLGVKINPNANTEVLGMLRIRNEFGGFWGAGVTFDVRQLHVRGVAKNFLMYQIGNIDYKLTPYTFFNHNADILTSSAGSFRMKERVMNYESFYSDNTWRQQGASYNFALAFPKVIQRMEFNGFITRLNPSNFSNVFDRLYGGGNVIISQSSHIDIGLNYVSIFDLAGTALDSNLYRNSVSTVNYDFHIQVNDVLVGLDGETGSSRVGKSLEPDSKLSDYFVHTRAYFDPVKKPFKFHVGYINNGADFRSFGAQSKRVNFDQPNNMYKRFTNEQILRPVSIYDMYNDPMLTNTGITVGLMNYNPAINNVLPYGLATFNRSGFYAGASYEGKQKITSADFKSYGLREIRGQGTTKKKSFFMNNLTVDSKLAKLWGGKRSLNLNLGLSHQFTSRQSEIDFEQVNLQSVQVNGGLEFELVENLFVLSNVFILQSQGKDQMPMRNAQDEVVDFETFEVNGQDLTTSFGLRFDFTEDNFLGIFYEMNQNNFVPDHPYRFNQASILYVLKF